MSTNYFTKEGLHLGKTYFDGNGMVFIKNVKHHKELINAENDFKACIVNEYGETLTAFDFFTTLTECYKFEEIDAEDWS